MLEVPHEKICDSARERDDCEQREDYGDEVVGKNRDVAVCCGWWNEIAGNCCQYERGYCKNQEKYRENEK